MKTKVMYLMVLIASLMAMFVASAPLRASQTRNIESEYKKTYVYKKYLKHDSVKIESQKNGVVTLTGTVAGEVHKSLAEETVANLPGVTSVDNRLETKAEVATENADKWIERKVMLELLFHRYVNATKTTVEVKDGIVTLKGQASSSAQKDLTTEYARDIDGVKEVKNEMTVVVPPQTEKWTASEKIDDASITAQIKTALLIHHSTSSIKTKVETQNGEVTLTGIAKNAAEKSLVTKLVTDIHGVNGVKNDMTIEETTTK